jgi:hypothetical protein
VRRRSAPAGGAGGQRRRVALVVGGATGRPKTPSPLDVAAAASDRCKGSVVVLWRIQGYELQRQIGKTELRFLNCDDVDDNCGQGCN